MTAFAGTELGVEVEAHRTFGFTSWTYATTDPLEAVSEPGCFSSQSRRMQAGGLVLAGVWPGPGGVRRAPLMVSRAMRNGAVSVRVVQHYGGPKDEDAPPPERPRERGRPRERTNDRRCARGGVDRLVVVRGAVGRVPPGVGAAGEVSATKKPEAVLLLRGQLAR